MFRLLYDEVDTWGKGHVAECILIIARYELSDSQVVDKEINAMAMLIELLGVIKWVCIQKGLDPKNNNKFKLI